MADEFNCNSCGTLTDTGYFYCEKCHRMHKKKRDELIDNAASITNKEVLKQIPGAEPKQL